MTAKPLGALLVLLALAATGCVQPVPAAGDDEPVAVEGRSDPSGGAGLNPAPLSNSTPSHRLIGSNCLSWKTSQAWLLPDPPSPSPAGWESDSGVPSIVLRGFECQRIHFGSLERGPVNMVLEYTDHIVAPEACRASEQSLALWSLYGWGIDDEALVDALGAIGAPTYLIAADHAAGAAPLGRVETVEWAAPGHPSSSLSIVVGEAMQPIGGVPDRIFWQQGEGVTALDLVVDGLQSDHTDKAATGQLAPPHRLAGAYPAYAGAAQWYSGLALEGGITQWGDLSCAPSPSPPS